MNIGIHFLDILLWIFGGVEHCSVSTYTPTTAIGHLELERASVDWTLSIDRSRLAEGQGTYRSIMVDGEEVEFSGGFTDLHTQCYRQILAGHGPGPAIARPSIQLVHDIRTQGEKL